MQFCPLAYPASRVLPIVISSISCRSTGRAGAARRRGPGKCREMTLPVGRAWAGRRRWAPVRGKPVAGCAGGAEECGSAHLGVRASCFLYEPIPNGSGCYPVGIGETLSGRGVSGKGSALGSASAAFAPGSVPGVALARRGLRLSPSPRCLPGRWQTGDGAWGGRCPCSSRTRPARAASACPGDAATRSRSGPGARSSSAPVRA